MVSRIVRWVAGGLLGALIAGVPLAYSSYRQVSYRNFRVVEDGVLYRSGQLSPAALREVMTEYGLRTVITLRALERPGDLVREDAEEHWCRLEGLRYERIPPRPWTAPDGKGPPPAVRNVEEFLRIMDDPRNHPVLVHCFAGTHRTGALAAVYRMEKDHWSNAAAIREMRHAGYGSLEVEPEVLSFLESYVPRWKRAAGR